MFIVLIRTFSTRQSRNIVFETIIKTQNCLLVIFVLKEFIRSGNYIIYSQEAVTSDLNLHLLMARMMALQQMIDNKNTFPFILSQFFQYLLRQILFAVPLKIVLSQKKFVKR